MQKGRSMVEMMGVLILIAVLTVSILSIWTQVRTKMQVTQSQNEIFQIAQNVSGLYSWARDYSPMGADTQLLKTLCENDVFPGGCENNVPMNPFGGEYLVEKTSVGEGSDARDSYFTVTLTGLPSEGACDEVLGYDFENAVSMDCFGPEDNVSAVIVFQ